MTFARCALLLLAGLSAAGSRADEPPPEAYSRDAVLSSLRRAVDFLVKDQNPNGSWGGPRGAIYTFTGDVWSNPETHRSWTVGTTGLCVMALLEVTDSDASRGALERGVDYLLENALVRRPNEWDTMNCWAYIYGLQALAAYIDDPRFAKTARADACRTLAEKLVVCLEKSQALNGGWGYLEFDQPRTQKTQWATSFTTAAALVALQDARRAGIAAPEALLRSAARAVRSCRLPTGAYLYSVPLVATPGDSDRINAVKGSLSRIQSCNLALLLSGEDVPLESRRKGLEAFFRDHRFLDIARHRPIPHEAFYQNSGYFYMFGHYYAARMIESLPADERSPWWPKLQREVIKIQQADGSMWDYDMHAYHKPYGTAYGVLTLMRGVKHGGGELGR